AQSANAKQSEEQFEEMGDLLFTVVNLARHFHIDPEQALRSCNQKFKRRFSHIENELSKQNRSLEDASLQEMDELWNAAKSEG
ncbi:MAG: MazG nucleotide pyrophosphohydrolase domain-containing protein, partial [Pseudomonadota bacterium]